MKRLLYMVVVSMGCFSCITSCDGNGKSHAPIIDDSARLADSVAKVEAAMKAHCDSVEKLDSIARADSLAKSEALHATDSLLSLFDTQTKKVRDEIYDEGQFIPGNGSAFTEVVDPMILTYEKLKRVKKDMTPEQIARFNKLCDRVKEAL